MKATGNLMELHGCLGEQRAAQTAQGPGAARDLVPGPHTHRPHSFLKGAEAEGAGLSL